MKLEIGHRQCTPDKVLFKQESYAFHLSHQTILTTRSNKCPSLPPRDLKTLTIIVRPQAILWQVDWEPPTLPKVISIISGSEIQNYSDSGNSDMDNDSEEMLNNKPVFTRSGRQVKFWIRFNV